MYLREDLEAMYKVQIMRIGNDEFGLGMNYKKIKEEMINEILDAQEKGKKVKKKELPPMSVRQKRIYEANK